MRTALLAAAAILAVTAASSASIGPDVRFLLCLDDCAAHGDGQPPPPSPACSDGLDNDGDGLVDSSDPGCASGADASECNLRKFRPIAAVHTHGAYGTFVQAHDYIYADGTACPGSIVQYDSNRVCNPGSSSWDYDQCVANDPSGGVGAQGTFTCVSSTCAGAVSPHTLIAQVTPFETADGVGASCQYFVSSGIPTSDIETVCFVYLGD
jgi:hypothetical protein